MKKIIAFAIIILFIGMSISPSFSAELTKEDIIDILSRFTQKTSTEDGNNVYDLLILTPSKFSKTLQPLVTHKNSIGVKTKLETLSKVYEEMFWYGRDKPEKIKYFIKTSMEKWGIKYVLLVGDFKNMPVRYVYNDEEWEGYPEPYFLSELYFADIYESEGEFSSWDTNNNGIYGEWNGEQAQDYNIDLYPDVYVGRLACRTKIEVKIMVNKIIKYENNAYGSEWFNTMVVVAGDTYLESQNPNWTGYEGEENTQMALDNMSDFEHVKLWTSDGSFTGSKDVINAINNGCGFIFFDGHASPQSWSTCGGGARSPG